MIGTLFDELSLQQLLELSTDDNLTEDNPWGIGLLYSRLKLDGYLDGSDDVSDEEVLFRPGETRTNKNFPVLPTTIPSNRMFHSFEVLN